jgi:hypothetical protein
VSAGARDKRNQAVGGKFRRSRFGFPDKQRKEPGQLRKMADDENVSRFADETIAHPPGRVAGLQITGGGKFRERIARAPERFGGLFRSQLSAVPDDGRADAAAGGFAREKVHGRPSDRRQWALGINFRSDRIAVMNQVEMHDVNDSARGPQGIGGWLLVLCLLQLVWGPVNSALVASNALAALSVRGPSLAAALVALTLVTSFGVAAGIALLTKRGPAVTMATTALVLAAALDLVIYTTSYLPSNRMPGDAPFYVAGSLAYHGAWLAYLFRSRRVRNTY